MRKWSIALGSNILVPAAVIFLNRQNKMPEESGIILLFLTVSAIIIQGAVILSEKRKLRKFIKAMEAVFREQKAMLIKPKKSSREMNRLWNLLLEIVQYKAKYYYEGQHMLQAYYRFTPRNVEKLLGKDSIADVEVGDSVHMEGTIGMISIAGKMIRDHKRYLHAMNKTLEIIGKFQTEQDGVLFSNDSDLTSMKVLFMESTERAVQFGIDTMHGLYENGSFDDQNILLFLHHTALQYGIAGAKEQSFAFILSQDADALSDYLVRLRDSSVRMAVSETVASGMGKDIERRYLGYIELVHLNEKIKIYEILDAYREPERKQKAKMNGYFQKGLELYYKNDFYLARTHFAEVIKECPGDLIAKWYIFSCEKMINGDHHTDCRYGLFFE